MNSDKKIVLYQKITGGAFCRNRNPPSDLAVLLGAVHFKKTVPLLTRYYFEQEGKA